MAQYKGIKTYTKRQNAEFTGNGVKATSAINALFAVNITKRNLSSSTKRNKRNKLQLKPLPPPTSTKVFNQDSFNCELDDTFDRLLKDNPVTKNPIINNHVTSDSWESDYSDKVLQGASKHNRETKTDNVSETKPSTRSYKHRQIRKRKFPTDSFVTVNKHLDVPVDISLCIESMEEEKPEKSTTKSDHSSVVNVTKKFTCNDFSLQTNDVNPQQQNFFRPLLKNKFLCSTPNLTDHQSIVQNSVSPIKVFLSKSKVNSRTLSALQESFEEISDWEKRVPFETPKKKRRRISNGKKKLINFTNKKFMTSNKKVVVKTKKRRSFEKNNFIRAGTPEHSLDFKGFPREEFEVVDCSDHSYALISIKHASPTKRVYSNTKKSFQSTQMVNVQDASPSLFSSLSSDSCSEVSSKNAKNKLENDIISDPKFKQRPVVVLSNVVDILGIKATVSISMPDEIRKTPQKELVVDLTILPDAKLQEYLKAQNVQESNLDSISTCSFENPEKKMETSNFSATDCNETSEESTAEDSSFVNSLSPSRQSKINSSTEMSSTKESNANVDNELRSKKLTLKLVPYPIKKMEKKNEVFVTLRRGTNSNTSTPLRNKSAAKTIQLTPVANPSDSLSKTPKLHEIMHFPKRSIGDSKENASRNGGRELKLVYRKCDKNSSHNSSLYNSFSPSRNEKRQQANIICSLLNTSRIIEEMTQTGEKNETIQLTPDNIKKRIYDRFINLTRRKPRPKLFSPPQKSSFNETVLQTPPKTVVDLSPVTSTPKTELSPRRYNFTKPNILRRSLKKTSIADSDLDSSGSKDYRVTPQPKRSVVCRRSAGSLGTSKKMRTSKKTAIIEPELYHKAKYRITYKAKKPIVLISSTDSSAAQMLPKKPSITESVSDEQTENPIDLPSKKQISLRGSTNTTASVSKNASSIESVSDKSTQDKINCQSSKLVVLRRPVNGLESPEKVSIVKSDLNKTEEDLANSESPIIWRRLTDSTGTLEKVSIVESVVDNQIEDEIKAQSRKPIILRNPTVRKKTSAIESNLQRPTENSQPRKPIILRRSTDHSGISKKTSIVESSLDRSKESPGNSQSKTPIILRRLADSSGISKETSITEPILDGSTDVSTNFQFKKPNILRSRLKKVETQINTSATECNLENPTEVHVNVQSEKLTENDSAAATNSASDLSCSKRKSIIETILLSPQSVQNDNSPPRKPLWIMKRTLRSRKPPPDPSSTERRNSIIESVLQTPQIFEADSLPTKPRILRSNKPPLRKKSIIEVILQTSDKGSPSVQLQDRKRVEEKSSPPLTVRRSRPASPIVVEKTTVRFNAPPPPKEACNILERAKQESQRHSIIEAILQISSATKSAQNENRIQETPPVADRQRPSSLNEVETGDLLPPPPPKRATKVMDLKKHEEPKEAFVKPGKQYRRSLSLLRRSMFLEESKIDADISHAAVSPLLNRPYRPSVRIIPEEDVINSPVAPPLLAQYASAAAGFLSEQKGIDAVSTLELQLEELDFGTKKKRRAKLSAKGLVLLRCHQQAVLTFQSCYTSKFLHNCHKIGEGVYGEVFLVNDSHGKSTVMKVIPIEGDLMVNGERQKKFEEILSEIVIATELSALRTNEDNTTNGFNEVRRVRCVRGKYPYRMIQLWEEFDEIKKSENDHPGCFDKEQQFIILELANGGKDMESFVFLNAEQALHLFYQTACTLAVGESALEFEHRDMHWGNILIDQTEDLEIEFLLNGQKINVATCGIQVSIIDFTLSRIKHGGCSIFNDLAQDPELFQSRGDYQFDIYRLMQKRVKNNWKNFEPYTNVLWLHYTLDKMITQLRYKKPQTKTHSRGMEELQALKEVILNHKSAVDFVTSKFLQ